MPTLGQRQVIALCYDGKTSLDARFIEQDQAAAVRKPGLDHISKDDHARLKRLSMLAGSFEMGSNPVPIRADKSRAALIRHSR